MLHPYVKHFTTPSTVAGYIVKFRDPIDDMRHEVEVARLASAAHGSLFDCSIATGRLVGTLPGVTSYSGMDISEAFIAHVAKTFPAVKVKHGDLLVGIDEPDRQYDTVLCLRTMFALGQTEKIIREMLRIAKPGGTLIFDYGLTSRPTLIDGVSVVTSDADVPDILSRVGVASWRIVPLDGVLVRVKRTRILGRLVSMACAIAPLRYVITKAELFSLRFMRDRALYVVEV